jgi:hypothetical protein
VSRRRSSSASCKVKSSPIFPAGTKFEFIKIRREPTPQEVWRIRVKNY